MAVEVMSESGGKTLGVRATGRMSDEDYKEVWIPKLEEILGEHGSVRVLLYMDEGFEGFEPGAMWEDTKFGFGHIKTAAQGKFEKVAVVGGSKWYRRFGEIFGHLMPGEVKGFEGSELEKAWEWVKS
jgi:hypothetical protein